jgi:predicted glycoside hydrolase/deacetylase ChbG (UPF0249 family)
MNEIRLIVNADDFARSPGVNRGIIEAHQHGIVTTSTAMMNLDGAVDALHKARQQAPGLAFGVHLNITYGTPISSESSITSLLTDGGDFRNFHDLQSKPEDFEVSQVEIEWRSQIERFLGTGTHLDHLDSHHHVAVFHPDLFELFLNLAVEYKCGVRNPQPIDVQAADLDAIYSDRILQYVMEDAAEQMNSRAIHYPDRFLASFFAENTTNDHLKNLLKMLNPGVCEMMCHPGYADKQLRQSSSYGIFREQELNVLTHRETASLIDELQIELHTFQTAWGG